MAKNKKILLIVGAIVLLAVIVAICLFAFKDEEKATYIVRFNSNGGNAISEQVVEEGNSATKPQDPIRDGYIFIEWLLNGRSYDFNSIVDKDITLSAKWAEDVPEKELVTIKFNSDGGTTIANIVIEKGSKVEKPADPTKDGYTFVEWQLSDSKYDFEQEVTEDIELVAKWNKNKTEDKPSTNKPSNNNSGNNNSGNNNSGNNNSGNNNSGGSTTPTTPTTPTVKKYTVSFDSNGGSSVASQTVEEGKKASKPSNPTRSGYTFAGWTLNGSAYDFNSAVKGNITLVAKWNKNVNKYTVSFNSNGGSSVASQTVEEGNKATKPSNPTRSGYTFAGWTLNGSAYDFNSAVKGNITLVAKWTENVKNKYTVSFNSNGGSSVASQTVEEGNKATKPSDPTRSGYTFAGWTLNGSAYNFSSAVTGNITLVAKWNQKSYTIKISAVDDYSPARVLSVYENGSKITVKEIRYSDGTYLCSGSNPNVNKNVIAGETSFIVVLSDGTQVTARVS